MEAKQNKINDCKIEMNKLLDDGINRITIALEGNDDKVASIL